MKCEDFLIQIKDYPSWHLLVQIQQQKTRTDLFESNCWKLVENRNWSLAQYVY